MKAGSSLSPASDGMVVSTIDRALSRMKIKLHLEDSSGIAIEIPIKDLVEEQKELTRICKSASIGKLHHHAMRALFSMYIARDPLFKIPDYAVQYFKTTFSYKQDSDVIPITDNDSFLKAIQYGSEQHMFDDNDDIVLNCYCTIKNTHVFDLDRKLNKVIASSARMADTTVRNMRNLMTKLRKTNGWYRGEPSEGLSRHFVEKIFRYIFDPNFAEDLSLSSSTSDNQKNQSNNSTSAKPNISSALAGKISSVAGRISTFFHRLNQTIGDDSYSVSADSISPSVFEKINKSCSYSSSRNSDGNCNTEMKLPESPKAIEIVFDCEGGRTSAEWNLFFKVSGHDTMISLSDSSNSNDGGILVDDEDVISLDASSVSYELDMMDSESVQNEIEDFESYSHPSHVVKSLDIITCPSDEERSMDGVLVHADADVSRMEDSSVESWTEL